MTLANPNAPETMVPSSAEMFVADRWSAPLKNIWFYKNPTLASAGETVNDEYANGTLKKVKNGDKLTVTFELHEQYLPVLKSLQKGLISVSSEVASVTARVETYNAGSWGFNTDILLDKANADGSAIVPTKVEALIGGSWVALASGDDYVAWATSTGNTYIKFIKGAALNENAPKSAQIKVTYNATPDATLSIIKHNANALAEGFVYVIQWERDYNGNKRSIRILLENCLAEKGTMNPISDSDGTTSGYPISLTGTIKRHEFKGFATLE